MERGQKPPAGNVIRQSRVCFFGRAKIVFLPANKIEIQELENGFEVVGVARDEDGADLARAQSNEDIEVYVPGFVDIVVLSRGNSTDDASRLCPFPFGRCNEAKVLLQIVHEPLHLSRPRASGQFRQDDGAAANHEWEIHYLLLETPGPEVVDVDGCIENCETSSAQSRPALLFRCTA